VIIGVNRILAHEGTDYHLQIEDLGTNTSALEARVYAHGAVLWHRRVPYQDLTAKGLPKSEFEEALRALMEKTLLTVEAAVRKGKLT
jgi:hypothetical protein